MNVLIKVLLNLVKTGPLLAAFPWTSTGHFFAMYLAIRQHKIHRNWFFWVYVSQLTSSNGKESMDVVDG